MASARVFAQWIGPVVSCCSPRATHLSSSILTVGLVRVTAHNRRPPSLFAVTNAWSRWRAIELQALVPSSRHRPWCSRAVSAVPGVQVAGICEFLACPPG
jgi:hypothetical protein